MMKGYYTNIDLERIKEAGYESFGRPGLIRSVVPIYQLGEKIVLRKAKEALGKTGMNLENCVGFAMFTKEREQVVNYDVHDNSHYAIIHALKEIELCYPKISSQR
ncbi:MAG: hypothetical protein PVJ67_01615 [Candidatus Pacearchaeota archaeon]|jgi:hypothetical protein